MKERIQSMKIDCLYQMVRELRRTSDERFVCGSKEYSPDCRCKYNKLCALDNDFQDLCKVEHEESDESARIGEVFSAEDDDIVSELAASFMEGNPGEAFRQIIKDLVKDSVSVIEEIWPDMSNDNTVELSICVYKSRWEVMYADYVESVKSPVFHYSPMKERVDEAPGKNDQDEDE